MIADLLRIVRRSDHAPNPAISGFDQINPRNCDKSPSNAMTDEGLRNRFDFGAPPSWSTASSNASSRLSDTPSGRLPGAYIPDPLPYTVDEPVNVDTPPPADPVRPNPDKTCRICLSGVEDGISRLR